ncbi:MAG: ATP-binding protein [Cyanobacteria bacterium P01_C01_bin.73]
MSPSSSSSVSLYQIARAHPDTSRPFQVWAKGFKGILQSLFDYVVEQNRTTTCWLKLPPGNAWRSTAEDYCREAAAGSCTYWFQSEGLQTEVPEPPPANAAGNNYTPLPLPPDQKLRGEYHAIAIAEGFAIAVVAQRLKYSPNQSPSVSVVDLSTVSDESGESDEPETLSTAAVSRSANLDKKYYLKVILSVNPAVVGHLLSEGMRPVVTASAGYAPHLPALTTLLDQWERRTQVASQSDPSLIDRLLATRFKQQEDLRYALSGMRRRALAASDLSTHHEDLLNTLRLRDDFLSTVGQELRKPLTNIKTALTLLSASSLKTVQRQRYLDMISTECDRQSTLVNGVLDLLQLEGDLGQLPGKPVLLSTSLPGFISTYQPLAQEKGVTLSYTIAEQLPAIACPESWVKQIITHLIDNSLKFTATNGRVNITARAHGEDRIQMTIQDTGVGIPSSDLSQIFDCFYRGRQLTGGDPEGAGLGLTIVQQLLTYCGGDITVESQVGSGSVFRVYLPTA